VTLEGKVVLVTRARDRAGELSERLRARGAIALEAPAIRIEPVPEGGLLDEAIRDTAMRGHAWVAFTSAAGVEAWFDRARVLGYEARDLNARVAAVGRGTAESLLAHGARADLVPPTFTTEALGEVFPEGGGTVLLPRADIAPEELEEALTAKGWEPVPVDAYRSIPERSMPPEASEALAGGRVDAITFTSASTVAGFVQMAGVVRGPVVVCIGPVTARGAAAAGLEVAGVADPHTLDGLADAVERALSG